MDTRPDSLDTALAFADWGFRVVSVWGIKDGVCMCPKGAACDNKPGKHPIPRNGLTAATTDPDAITKMLSAPGSAGNYGIIPPPNVVAIDVDSEGWREKLRDLHLPRTMAVESRNGVHLFFHWPAEYGPQPTQLHGWLVRSQDHPGYTIGPGSTHQTGWVYRIAHQNGHDVHQMLTRIATFPRPDTAGSETVITTTGPVDPRTVEQGGRHHHLVKTARYLFGIGLTGEELFAAVQQVNLRFPEPKTEAEVRRAIGDVETKFLPDPEPVDVTALATSLIVPAVTYVANTDRHPRYASPLAVFGHVSLVSGPAKSGKSTLIAGLVRARERGLLYLWGDPIPTGPTLYISEESGASFADKVAGLTQTDVMDWSSFVRAGLTKRSQVLDLLAGWCAGKTDPLVIVDTLAVWSLINDENDAMETNRAIGEFNTLADEFKAAVLMGHHSRKGGGEHGEGIRGSSAIFGAVSLSIEFRYFEKQDDPRRRLALSGRFGSPEYRNLDFDLTTREYTTTHATPSYAVLTKDIPLESSGKDALSREDLRGIWGKDPRKDIATLLANNAIVERVVKSSRGSMKTVYFKAPPVLDTRTVAEEMASIFHPRDGDTDERE